MAFMNGHDAHDGHVFTTTGSDARPTRSTRSWTDNGVHYTVETRNWGSPQFSFGTVTGSARGGPFRSSTAPNQPTGRFGTGGGLLGGAFDLFEDLLSLPQATHNSFAPNTRETSSRRRVLVEVESDTDDDDDDDDAYDYERRRKPQDQRYDQPKSLLSKMKDKLLDGRHRTRHFPNYDNDRGQSYSRERSPARSPNSDRRQSSFHTLTREPPRTQPRSSGERPAPEYIEVDHQDDKPAREQDKGNGDIIEALQNAVEFERRAVRSCKKRLEQATRQPAISSHHLQGLLDELKSHEQSLKNAQISLHDVKATQRSTEQPPQPQRATSQRSRPSAQRQSSHPPEDEFFNPFETSFSPPFIDDPIFRAFQSSFSRGGFGGIHEGLFEQMRNSTANNENFQFFGPPPDASRKRFRYSMPSGGNPRFQRPGPGFTNFASSAQPQQPPANLMKAHEAQALYNSYNERWNALPPHDANVPYPARGLQPHALAARDSIWAPLCNATVSTWSDETVMQANAQAFYLGVVGLVPRYTETPTTGRIEMGFDKSKASPKQVKDLVDMLKKERNRWHSDRLGRRNGGMVGSNESLQKDERARAVFHAVCELLDRAQ